MARIEKVDAMLASERLFKLDLMLLFLGFLSLSSRRLVARVENELSLI